MPLARSRTTAGRDSARYGTVSRDADAAHGRHGRGTRACSAVSNSWLVNGADAEHVGDVLAGFGERGVRVDGGGDVFGGGAHLDGQCRFGDHLAGVRAAVALGCSRMGLRHFVGPGRRYTPADLAEVLGSWGPCEGCPADFNADGMVNAADLAQVLGAWGMCP